MRQEEIILIGGGGHAESCIDVIEAEGRFKIVGIIDVAKKVGTKVLGYPIIATDQDLRMLSKKYKNFFITVGQVKSPQSRIKIYRNLKKLKLKLPTIISPNAYVSLHSKIGEGTVIMHHAFVNSYAKVGANCIINTGAIVEHGVTVGDYCHISTGAVVNGEAQVAENSFVGSNAVLREQVKISKGGLIGAGAVVISDTEADSTYIGNPARRIKK